MQHTGSTLPQWAKNLKKYRKLSGFSQEEFGRQFGVTAMAVSYWESGTNEPPVKVMAWLLVAAGVVSKDSVSKAGFEFGEPQ